MPVEHRSEPVGSLRVTAAEVVVEVPLVGQQEHGHAPGTIGAATTVARMTGHRILSGADARLRVAPWRGDASTAHLLPGRSRADRGVALADAGGAGRHRLRSGPDRRAARRRSSACSSTPGFEVHERLHLLVRDLDGLARLDAGPAELRRGHHGDRPRILAVDAAAFPPFWQLDAPGLEDAVAATPVGPPAGRGGAGRAPAHRRLRRHRTGRAPRLPPATRRRPARAGRGDRRRARGRRAALAAPLGGQGGAGEHPGGERRRGAACTSGSGFRLQPDGLAVLRRPLGEAS